jgi:hypothetical protein
MDWDLLPDSGDQAHCDVRNIVNPSVGVCRLSINHHAVTVVGIAPPGLRLAGSRHVDRKWPATRDP